MIEKLNAGFVNTWVLRNDLMRYAEVGAGTAAAPASQRAANAAESPPANLKRAGLPDDALAFTKRVHEHYTYPVDSLIFDADGKFVGDLAASDILMDFHGGDKRYLELLAKAPAGSSK